MTLAFWLPHYPTEGVFMYRVLSKIGTDMGRLCTTTVALMLSVCGSEKHGDKLKINTTQRTGGSSRESPLTAALAGYQDLQVPGFSVRLIWRFVHCTLRAVK